MLKRSYDPENVFRLNENSPAWESDAQLAEP
jgi:hypothetical protein